MRRLAPLIMALLATTGAAEEWAPMTGAQIQTALTDRILDYDDAWQRFYASGRTLYNAGQDSWGYWAVRGDQYCSQWPPGEMWECYDMAEKPGQVRFIDAYGNATDGIFRKP